MRLAMTFLDADAVLYQLSEPTGSCARAVGIYLFSFLLLIIFIIRTLKDRI